MPDRTFLFVVCTNYISVWFRIVLFHYILLYNYRYFITPCDRAENLYCETMTDGLKGLQNELYEDMLSHLKETDDEVNAGDKSTCHRHISVPLLLKPPLLIVF